MPESADKQPTEPNSEHSQAENNQSDPVPPVRPNGKPRPESDGDPQESPRQPMPFPIVIVVLATIFLMYLFLSDAFTDDGQEVSYGFFFSELKRGNVTDVVVNGEKLTGQWKTIPDNPDPQGKKLTEKFFTILPPVEDSDLMPALRKYDPYHKFEPISVDIATQFILWMVGPLLLLGFFWFMMRRASDPMGSSMFGNFVRSPAKRFEASQEQATFKDVASMEQAKMELMEVVEFLKKPEKFLKLGAEIPKGVLLVGPPGTGKTLLARATAGEADVPFFSISGSEFIQMFVGVGASRVRDMFQNAKRNAPCIIFIDEIDAVGRIRGAGVGGGHDEREQTLNQILSEMDGFTPTETVIVLAATNRPDVLDPALLRPGRFDRHITIDRPTKEGRVAILKIHTRKKPLASDVDLEEIANGSIGFSGADLKNLCNEAALIATRANKTRIEREDFESARDRVLMGPKREEVLNEHERELTAYHESGHTLLAWLLPELDPVFKVTIIPRGRSLGVTQLIPDEDRYNIGENRLHAQLAMMLAGRAAEKLVFDEYSAGAEDDLKKATKMARKMVAHWGMSDVIGPVAFRQGEDHPFLGKEMHEQREFSEETAHVIDQEVQQLLITASERATEILINNRADLDHLAKALLEKEALGKDEITDLIGARMTAPAE